MPDFFTHDVVSSRTWRGRPYLISPLADFALAGGFALIAFVLLFVFFPLRAPDYLDRKLILAASVGWLAYIVNDPHFMASYQLLYHGYREKLQRFRHQRELHARYLLAGIIVPAAMALYFFYALSAQSAVLFAYAAQAMMVLVAWHYSKQAFGVFMMLSAMKNIIYSRTQRLFLLVNSYIVWITYSVIILSHPTGTDILVAQIFGGIPYTVDKAYFQLPKWCESILALVWMGGALLAILVTLWDKKRASITAITGYFSMYYFLFAASLHPLWIFLYPLFHSLQYLMFVYAYKRGENHITQQSPHLLPRFFMISIVLGVMFFWAVPGASETLFNPDNSLLLPITGAFVIFINIHHYFIDNVLWRKEHVEISEYLFSRP